MIFRIDKRIKSESAISIAVYTQILSHSSRVDGKLYSSLLQKTIADNLDVRIMTVSNSDYLDMLSKLDIKMVPVQASDHIRYTYYLNTECEDYFHISDAFISRVKELGYKLWSFILKLRACSDSNMVEASDADLYKEMNLSRNTFKKYITQAIEAELIFKNDNGYLINSLTEHNKKVDIFAEYAESKGSTYYHSKTESMIAEQIFNAVEAALRNANSKLTPIEYINQLLETKFKNLPSKLNINYFSRPLIGVGSKRKNNSKNNLKIVA